MKYPAISLTLLLLATPLVEAQPPAGRGRAPVAPTATSRRPTAPTPQGRLGDRNLRATRGSEYGRLRAAERGAQRIGAKTRRTGIAGSQGQGGARREAAGLNRTTPISAQERALQERLAEIDRLRDNAIETGNVALLERAEQLERQARDTHARMGRGNAVIEDGTTVPFGQLISAKAREMGREFGQFTSEQARTLGRDFGQSNANKTRLLEPLPPITEDPALEAAAPETTTPTTSPTGDGTSTDPSPQQ